MPVNPNETEKQPASSTSSAGVDLHDVAEYSLLSFREYAKSNPQTIALWSLGIGFVLGWKLKPW
ncbi:MAG: hypothetical protein JWM11_5121 [Planctomycetaceae bacterium]|nr:hypothetical protein [Planctomycetaceae bacterium]